MSKQKSTPRDDSKTIFFLILSLLVVMVVEALVAAAVVTAVVAVVADAKEFPAYWAGVFIGVVLMYILLATNPIQLPQSQMQNVTTTSPTTTIQPEPFNAFALSCGQLQELINGNLTYLTPQSSCFTASCIADSGLANSYLQIYAGKGCYNQT